MTSVTKQKMIEGAVQLLATKGLQATSFSEVLELTGAPRGSIYYHFPNGKDELIIAALDLAGQRTLTAIETRRGSSPTEITTYFLDLWRQLLTMSHMKAGCSVLAVTIAADSPELLKHAAKIFDEWQAKLTSLFEYVGIEKEAANDFSLNLITSSEGAVVLTRAQQSMDTFESITKQLVAQSALL